jgi:hypothetical protein
VAGIESDDPALNWLLISSGSEQLTASIAQQQADERCNDPRCDEPLPISHSSGRPALSTRKNRVAASF